MNLTLAADFVVFLVTCDSDFDCKPLSGWKSWGRLMSLIANSYVTATCAVDFWGLPSLLILVLSVSLVLAADSRATFHP